MSSPLPVVIAALGDVYTFPLRVGDRAAGSRVVARTAGTSTIAITLEDGRRGLYLLAAIPGGGGLWALDRAPAMLGGPESA